MTTAEFRALCDHAMNQVSDGQEGARVKWGFDAYARWDFDEEGRTLAFTDPARSTLIAEVRLVGAFDPATSTFHWSWANYDRDHLLIAGIPSLRTYGDVRGISQLTTNDWDAKMTDGWRMTALAGYLLGCAGVYRADYDDKFWFMLLGNWRHSRAGSTTTGSTIDE
jgi:hypothetical protein